MFGAAFFVLGVERSYLYIATMELDLLTK